MATIRVRHPEDVLSLPDHETLGDAVRRGLMDAPPEANGHCVVRHGRDVHLVAWGCGRQECMVEALNALVEYVAEGAGGPPAADEDLPPQEAADEDLLADLLREVLVHANSPTARGWACAVSLRT